MKFIHHLRAALAAFTAFGLLSMMLLMFVDVVGRKLFSQPVPGSVELGELLLLLTTYTAIPLVSDNQEHVQLDFADKLIPAKLQNLQLRFGELLCGLLAAGCSWVLWARAIRAAADSETTTLLHVPFAPFYYVVAVMLLLTAAIHIFFGCIASGKSDDKQQLEI